MHSINYLRERYPAGEGFTEVTNGKAISFALRHEKLESSAVREYLLAVNYTQSWASWRLGRSKSEGQVIMACRA